MQLRLWQLRRAASCGVSFMFESHRTAADGTDAVVDRFVCDMAYIASRRAELAPDGYRHSLSELDARKRRKAPEAVLAASAMARDGFRCASCARRTPDRIGLAAWSPNGAVLAETAVLCSECMAKLGFAAAAATPAIEEEAGS